MMRKPRFILCITLCLCLVACGAEEKEEKSTEVTEIATEAVTERETETVTETEERTEVTTEDTEAPTTEEEKEEVDYSPYYEIIDHVESITGSEEDLKYYTEEPGGLSVIFFQQFYLKDDIGYAIQDLDGNGIDELIFCDNGNPDYPSESGSLIFNIYTINNGKLENVFYGWERNTATVTKDGNIINFESGGAAYQSWFIYDYKDNQLILKECIYSDLIDNNLTYFRSYEKYMDENAEQISQEEAFDYIDSFDLVKFDITIFNREKFRNDG